MSLIQNLQPVKDKLEVLDDKLDLLLSAFSPQFIFTELNLNATVTTNTSNGWVVTPTNLSNIFDDDLLTSTNQFEVTGSGYPWGEILVNPLIAIPEFTKLDFRIGIATNNPPNRPAVQVEIFSSGDWTTVWAFFGRTLSNTNADDFIKNISVITPYVWTQLKIRIWDLGYYGTRCKIYNLKVYSVS